MEAVEISEMGEGERRSGLGNFLKENGKMGMRGALARITCIAEDENGYERTPFSMVSHKSNENGFFMATFLVSDVLGSDVNDMLKLKECKVFLEGCPMEAACKIASDVNNGVSGAPLSSYRFLPQKVMALYTVGPFIYTSNHPDDHY
ncbi:protein SEED AND ROOT HAIR PROTECTIVE PROTEIN-like [Cannabis sativa]|uniref:protein SEED AND ROOT HAIR PROTECTIVE PROTEIN-like n=1 Tax=Cannabis sativa TaxID=3483 RepID=UPI0029CA8FA6|nr:protein SEED AND ROOT HAIR PROTECTIVE PROTEIN-like [Cannabis sativa]